MTEVVHRADTGRSYAGISMHAAPGVHEHALRLLKSRLPVGGSVVDIGTGSGALSARLHDAGYEVTACDIDGSDYAATPPLVVWNASADSLPVAFEPGSFDCICAVEVLEHVENPMQALRNFFAMLKPGGLILASTPNVSHPRSRLKFFVSGEPSYFGRTEYFSSGHRTILPDWMLELHLKEAGFADVRLNYAGSLGLKGKQGLLYKGLRPVFQALRMLPGPRVDDGCVTFAVGRKPG